MFNETRVMGRLTSDPEIRYTQSNQKVASFTLACDREYKGRDGKEITDFFNCVAWRAKAEFAEKYLRKGRLMLIAGRFENRKWQDRDGNNRVSTELIVEDYYFTGEPKREQQAPPQMEQGQSDFQEITGSDDDLPF